jgi:chitin synthase
MSRYPPEADEAQRRHYNDGFNPYSSPYDQNFDHSTQGPYDPFLTPSSFNSQQYPSPAQASYFSSPPPPPPPAPPLIESSYPPPQSDPYGHPTSHFSTLNNTHNNLLSPPPPPPTNYGPLVPYTGPSPGPSPIPITSPITLQHDRYPYRDDDHENDHDIDTGDIPLLRRDTSNSSLPMPGSYDEEPTNIRYGRIPQRIQRRYKTIKRVEYVPTPSQLPTLTLS